MSKQQGLKLAEPSNALYRVKRGLSAYVSYLAACEMNEAFSEYVLYEPILRILTSRGYSVRCEVECPGVEQPKRGDKKRLDFVAKGHEIEFALEVKWAKHESPDISRDIEKLTAWSKGRSLPLAFLCVFGTQSAVEKMALPKGFKERGQIVIADLKTTKYSCRVFQLLSVPVSK